MNWIETIGPPGVGKTFLLRKLMETSIKVGFERSWIAEKEIPATLCSKITLKDCNGIFSKLLLGYVKQDWLFYKKQGAQVRLVNSIFTFNPEQNNPQDYELQQYFEKHLEAINKFGLPTSQAEYIQKGYKRLLQRLVYHSNLDIPLLFLEEGVILNNYSLNRGIIDRYTQTKPALVLYYEEKEQVIFQRIKQREQERGRRWILHKGLSDRELKNRIEVTIRICQLKRNLMIQNGVKVIDINSDVIGNEEGMLHILQKIETELF